MQATLTVAAGKRLIAKAVASLSEVQQALKVGRVLLIGGTTVSAVSEELGFGPLWISGRIDAHGCRTAREADPAVPHTLLLAQQRGEPADSSVEEIASGLGPQDVIVTGANVLDTAGRAAIALAAPGGGIRGRALQLAVTQGVPIIVTCGLEKLAPGTVGQAVRSAGRASTDASMGAAIGLMPLDGRVITELEALFLLYGVRPTVIASGGIAGGEGSKTFILEGTEREVGEAAGGILALKDAVTSGAGASFEPCSPGCRHCRRHKGCVYLGREGVLLWPPPNSTD